VTKKKKEPPPPWAAVGIVSTSTEEMARRIAQAANDLEFAGYEVRDPMLYGAHFIVYGRQPKIEVKVVGEK